MFLHEDIDRAIGDSSDQVIVSAAWDFSLTEIVELASWNRLSRIDGDEYGHPFAPPTPPPSANGQSLPSLAPPNPGETRPDDGTGTGVIIHHPQPASGVRPKGVLPESHGQGGGVSQTQSGTGRSGPRPNPLLRRPQGRVKGPVQGSPADNAVPHKEADMM